LEEETKICKYCGSNYIPLKKGLHNWKNLFKWPTFNDFLILFIIILMIFSSWAYKRDIKTCRDYIAEQPQRIAELEQSYQEKYSNCSNWCIGSNLEIGDQINISIDG